MNNKLSINDCSLIDRVCTLFMYLFFSVSYGFAPCEISGFEALSYLEDSY